jgi:hypothetical protein
MIGFVPRAKFRRDGNISDVQIQYTHLGYFRFIAGIHKIRKL